MLKFIHIVKKELKLVFRDIHSVVVLFVLPVFFILIMSLALQNSFGDQPEKIIQLNITNYSQNTLVKNLIQDLQQLPVFDIKLSQSPPKELKQFALIFNKEKGVQKNSLETPPMKILVNPETDKQTLTIFQQTLQLLILKHKSLVLGKTLPAFAKKTLAQMETKLPEPQYLYPKNNTKKKPTSTQQNVPAWLVFAMFFISIPISTIFINEKACGTYARLKSMNVSYIAIVSGKIIPYFIINQIQMLLMVIVGFYLVPLLGGTALAITGSYAGLLLMSAAVSLAAISFALAIGSIAKTVAEASTFGGISNLIFGAIGGLMVPKFVMPEALQKFSVISPMSWGLEGFLNIILHGGSLRDVLPEAALLLFFALICLTLTIGILHKTNEN